MKDEMMTDATPHAPDQPAQPRCAHCGALLAPGISWCAQCYAPIAPTQAERPVAGSRPPPDEPEKPDDLSTPVTPAWSPDGSDDDAEVPDRGPLVGGSLDPETAARADHMLAQLGSGGSAGQGSAGRSLASVTSALSNTGVRIAVVVAGTVLLSVLGFALLAILGRLL